MRFIALSGMIRGILVNSDKSAEYERTGETSLFRERLTLKEAVAIDLFSGDATALPPV
jgi:hypothetical protein